MKYIYAVMISFVSSFTIALLICLQPVDSTTSIPCMECDDEDVCVDGMCQHFCLNRTSSGECIKCRDSKAYGKNCESTCPLECLNSICYLNKSDVICTDGCVNGKRGDSCRVSCPAACTQCERYIDKCIGPCSSPYLYGVVCKNICPKFCRAGCDRDTGECNSCKTGFTDENCNSICPENCSDCDKVRKICHGCKSGYRGIHCNDTCPGNCTECEQFGNNCIQCVEGKRGNLCDKDCHSSCVSCLQYDNRCTGPCKTKPCNSTCDTIKDRTCTECHDSLFHGTRCERRCSSNCNGPCDKDNGNCYSCKNGYRGKLCIDPCPMYCSICERTENKCLRCADGGNGDTCDDSYKIPEIVWGILVVVLALGLTTFAVLLKRRQYKRRKKLNKQQTDHGQLCNSHVSEYSDGSHYYTSKYWEIDDNDIDPDSSSDDAIAERQGRLPQLSQHNEESSVSPQRKSSGQQCESHPPELLVSDEDSNTENELCASAQCSVSNVATELTTQPCHSDEVQNDTRMDRRTPLRTYQADEIGRVCSLTSGHCSLSAKSMQTLFLEENHDFSNVSVRYVTPRFQDAIEHA